MKVEMDLEQHIAEVAEANPGVRIDCYVLFFGHTDAMALYNLAKERGIGARISTTPRDARSSCGVSLLIACDDALGMQALAQEAGIPVEGIVALPCQINPQRDRYC